MQSNTDRENMMIGFSSRWQTGLGPGRNRIAAGGCLLAGLLAAPAFAAGSWIWLDAQGRKVYSDLPPPSTLSEQRILQRPEVDVAPPSPPPQANPQTAPAAGDGRPAAAPGRPLYQRNEEALRENCRRARAALQTLNSGLRLQIINDQGEQVEMDEARRAQEVRRTQQEERDNCAPERNGR